MHGAIEAVGSGYGIQIGPEGFHNLLSSHTPFRAAEQAAKQNTRAPAPRAIFDFAPHAINFAFNGELAQQINTQYLCLLHVNGCYLSLPVYQRLLSRDRK